MPKRGNNKIQKLVIKNGNKKNVTWFNVVNPHEKEIAILKKDHNFLPEDLHDSLSRVSAFHAKINVNNDYIFLALRFPYYNHANNIIDSTEIDFFVGKDYVIMLHNNKIPALKKLFAKLGEKNNITNAVNLFYTIINNLLSNSFDLLDHISAKADEVEDVIFSRESKIAATALLDLRRSAINFRTITQNYENILEKFDRGVKSIELKNSASLHAEVSEKTKDLWETIENRKQTIEALYATNESILNYRLNDIMKTLTIFSVIVFPLTLLAAIFGMNTMNGMPFINTYQGFWIIIATMLVGSAIMLLLFKKKGWL